MKRASILLKHVADHQPNGKVPLRSFLDALGHQSFALALLFLSLPHAIPWPEPPGLSAVTGIPILLISSQLAMGKTSIWLPRWLDQKKFSPRLLKKLLSKLLPAIRLLEKILRPRNGFFSTGHGERIMGFVIAVMAVILCLPIPAGNILPGISIFLLSLALLERDSILACVSILVSAVSIYIMYQLIAKAVEALSDYIAGLL